MPFDDDEAQAMGAFELHEESELDMYDAQQLKGASGAGDALHEPDDNQIRAVEILNVLDNSIGILQGLLQENLQLREPIEQRWILDNRRWLGDDIGYDKERHDGQIRAVPNVTRAKGNIAISRIGDLLMPNNEKNWGINSTPLPELVKDFDSEDLVQVNGENFQNEETGAPVTTGDIARRKVELAKEACEAMSQTIDDQLTESNYLSESRQALYWMVKFGTAIMKGPDVENRAKSAWIMGEGGYEQKMLSRHVPVCYAVHPNDFVPDMSACQAEEMDFSFERSFLSKRQLRRMAKEKGFIPGQIKRLLLTDPASTHVGNDQVKEEGRAANDTTSITDDSRYELWEYQGPIEAEVLLAGGMGITENDIEDPTVAHEGRIWFCGPIALKIIIDPMADIDGELNYSIACYEDDEHGLFGYSLGHCGAGTQNSMTDAWSAMLDNNDKAAGVQLVRVRGMVNGADGDDKMKRNKMWEAERTDDVTKAFHIFSLPNNQEACSNIYQMCRELYDEEVQVPQLAGGEQGTATDTMGGMAMLMNSVGAVFRRVVRKWDDGITSSLISRYYNWNMNFNEDESIKGDFEVEAKGTSTLLVKEIMGQSLLGLLQISQQDPDVRGRTKVSGIIREWAKSQYLPVSDVLMDDDEYEVEQQKQASQQQEPEISDAQIKQMEMEDKNKEREFKIMLAQNQERLQMAMFAQSQGFKKEELEQKIKDMESRHTMEQQKLKLNWETFRTEAKIKLKTGSGF